jgi:hypothetical protein
VRRRPRAGIVRASGRRCSLSDAFVQDLEVRRDLLRVRHHRAKQRKVCAIVVPNRADGG